MKNLAVKGLQTEVYDEKGNKLSFSNEQAIRFTELEKTLKTDLTKVARTLVEIQESGFYLMRGYLSFKEYVNDALAYSYSTVQRYIAVEKSFAGVLEDYSQYPITRLVEVAKDPENIEKIKKAKNKDKVLSNIITSLAEKKKELLELEPPSSKIELDYPRLMESHRSELMVFYNFIEQHNFFESEDALEIFGQILADMKDFMKGIEPIILVKIEDIRERKEREKSEEKPVDGEIVEEGFDTDKEAERLTLGELDVTARSMSSTEE